MHREARGQSKRQVAGRLPPGTGRGELPSYHPFRLARPEVSYLVITPLLLALAEVQDPISTPATPRYLSPPPRYLSPQVQDLIPTTAPYSAGAIGAASAGTTAVSTLQLRLRASRRGGVEPSYLLRVGCTAARDEWRHSLADAVRLPSHHT